MTVRVLREKSRLKFAIYARKSKYIQTSESVESQIKMCKDYIRIRYPDVTDDDSAKDMEREDFQRMMKAAKNKEFNFVVCYRLDRLNRNPSDFSATYKIL